MPHTSLKVSLRCSYLSGYLVGCLRDPGETPGTVKMDRSQYSVMSDVDAKMKPVRTLRNMFS